MDWYYSEAGRQVGPVAEGAFEELVRIGKVTGETLVWRDGLPNWQVYRTLRPAAAPPQVPAPAPPPPPAAGGAPPVIGTAASCAECGYLFPNGEMISYGDVWVCARCKPVFFQRIREGAPLAAGAASAWRSGDAVVLPVGGTFPARCVKCNRAPQGAPAKRTLAWHQPWLYALLVSPVIYIIVALLVRKTAKVEVPICDEDRSRWRMWVTISWVSGLAGLLGIFVAIGMESGTLGLIAVVTLLTGLFLGPLKATLVTAKKIDRDYVWVRGTCKDYRELLPEFPEYR
jgi:hypothetical protein